MSGPHRAGDARPLTVQFVLPSYLPVPVGGYRVVHQYANYLAARGHAVSVAFPRFCIGPDGPRTARQTIGAWQWAARLRLRHRPLVDWQRIHPAVTLRLVRDISDASLPDADAVFATGWRTARPVMRLAGTKGRKFYLIQHHETWDGPEAEVDATWRLPMHKVVISRWLLDLGARLGASDIVHIPNAIAHDTFRILRPPSARDGVCALYSTQPFKGTPALLAVLARFHAARPATPVRMFGTGPRGADLPGWIAYHRNPPQRVLVEEIYNRSLVYVGASIAEGWALPPAEAMACGCLFVGTDIGGFRDYARDGVTALLSPPGDADALLRNLLAGVTDADLRQRVARAGTAAIAAFTWDVSGGLLEARIARAVAAGAGASAARPIPARHPPP